MPENPKFYNRGDVLFITASIEEGLALPPNVLINSMLLSVLSRAQRMYPIIIDSISISATHIHMIVVVLNPENVSNFMKYFKAESAHALNRMRGVKKRTIWCAGYDSPPIYKSIGRLKGKMAYTLANPVKDDLVENIAEYPGINSLKYLISGREEVKIPCLWMPRCRYTKLPTKRPSQGEFLDYLKNIQKTCQSMRQYLVISPGAAMKAMGVKDKAERAQLIEHVKARVQRIQEDAAELRAKEDRTAIGPAKLVKTPILDSYTPERTGKKMIVIADRRRRKRVIRRFRELVKQAKFVVSRWKLGDFSLRYPKGLFPPSMPRLVNAVSTDAALFFAA